MNSVNLNINLMKPELYRIKDKFGRRCYRRNVPSSSHSSQQSADIEERSNFGDSGTSHRLAACGVYDGDEPPCGTEDEDNYEITFNDKFNSYTTKMAIAQEYLKHIIGRQGETKKRLESQTKTRIEVPKIGHEGDIVITGSIRANVASCRRHIEMLVDSARQRKPFTHFIGFPFNTDEIMKNFVEFKQLVLEECGDARGLDVSIFQVPQRLHLTVGMLVLLSNNERTMARETLEQCKNDVIVPYLANVKLPLRARLKGLNYMNDDPSDVHVLYGKVGILDGNDLNVLQDLANKIVDYFVQKNVMPRKQYETVKLHVTLLNTRYRSNEDDEDEANGAGGINKDGRNFGMANRQSFDARKILEKFGDFDFGIQPLKELHILQRHARQPEGYYICTCKIDMY